MGVHHVDSVSAERTRAAAAMQRNALFAGVSANHLYQLLGDATRETLPAGETLFRERDPADALYVLMRGSVRCWIGVGGARRLAREIHAPECFGERECLARDERTFEAVAMPGSVMFRVTADRLHHHLAGSYSLRRALERASVASDVVTRQIDAHAAVHVEVVQLVGEPDAHLASSATRLVADAIAASFGDRVVVVTVGDGGRLVGPVQARPGLAARVEVSADAARVLGSRGWRALAREYDYAFVDPFGLEPPRRDAWRPHLNVALTLSDEPGLPDVGRAGPSRARYHAVLIPAGGWRRPVSLPVAACRLATTKDRVRAAGGQLDALDAADRAAVQRWARGVTDRTVGVALGGGGAWGYAHVALLRGLCRRDVPIDVVSGASFGSIVGAYYTRYGEPGLDRVIADAPRIQWASRGAVVWSGFIERTMRPLVPGRLEDLDTVLLPVATDVVRGRLVPFRRATIAHGVRASGSFPGAFGATLTTHPELGGLGRFVDGGIVSNVPDGPLFEEGADFVVASNVVPFDALQK